MAAVPTDAVEAHGAPGGDALVLSPHSDGLAARGPVAGSPVTNAPADLGVARPSGVDGDRVGGVVGALVEAQATPLVAALNEELPKFGVCAAVDVLDVVIPRPALVAVGVLQQDRDPGVPLGRGAVLKVAQEGPDGTNALGLHGAGKVCLDVGDVGHAGVGPQFPVENQGPNIFSRAWRHLFFIV